MTPTLRLLRQLGLDPASDEARRAIELVRANARWEHEDEPYFEGEVEPCINGQAVAIGAYFAEDLRGIVDRLLTEQMDDGGIEFHLAHGNWLPLFSSAGLEVLDLNEILPPADADHGPTTTTRHVGRNSRHPRRSG